MLPPEVDLNTVRQPPPTRAPSYRQAYQGYRNGEDVGGRGAVHAIRAATYMSGGLATPHGSAAQFKRVSSVNLLATSLEHATELYDELERLDSQLKISGLLSGCVGVAFCCGPGCGYARVGVGFGSCCGDGCDYVSSPCHAHCPLHPRWFIWPF